MLQKEGLEREILIISSSKSAKSKLFLYERRLKLLQQKEKKRTFWAFFVRIKIKEHLKILCFNISVTSFKCFSNHFCLLLILISTYFSNFPKKNNFSHFYINLADSKKRRKMYAKIFVALSVISFLCLESVQPASIGSIAQNIHSDLILLDANLGSSLRTNRDGRRINLDRFAVPSGKQISF